MKADQGAPATIDEYIAGFPREVQEILQQIRTTIRSAAPDAEETISYQIPTFTLNGRYLIYFAAHSKHVALYPAPMGDAELQAELAAYRSGKGTLKFPLEKPLPLALIARIVELSLEENRAKAAAKGKKRS
jgi:uncharacterized protein YdhG (YjbR/CyaY superfamily)